MAIYLWMTHVYIFLLPRVYEDFLNFPQQFKFFQLSGLFPQNKFMTKETELSLNRKLSNTEIRKLLCPLLIYISLMETSLRLFLVQLSSILFDASLKAQHVFLVQRMKNHSCQVRTVCRLSNFTCVQRCSNSSAPSQRLQFYSELISMPGPVTHLGYLFQKHYTMYTQHLLFDDYFMICGDFQKTSGLR